MNEALLGMLFKAFPPEMLVQKAMDKFGPEVKTMVDFIMKLETFGNALTEGLKKIEAQNEEILTLLRGDLHVISGQRQQSFRGNGSIIEYNSNGTQHTDTNGSSDNGVS